MENLIHPGEVLKNEFRVPLKLSQYKLAKEIKVPRMRISAIEAGNRAITADTALRLAQYFDTTPQFWLNLQSEYDLRKETNGGTTTGSLPS